VINREYFNVGVITNSKVLEEQKQTTHALLLTCREIYLGVSALVYGTNRLQVTFHEEESLQFLLHLTPTSLRHVKDLTVLLAVFPPDEDEHCRESCGCWHGPLPTIWIVDGATLEGKALLTEWEKTVEHIAQHVKPSTLRLNLICDVEDIETAQQVVQPLSQLPTLLDCSIRFNFVPEPDLQTLARSTAIRLMGHSEASHETAFRFMDLPVELRLQILENTDLVTPLREVEWNPTDNFYLRYCERQCVCCGCPVQKPHRYCWQYVKAGCFCHRYHAAYTQHCKCWAPPIALFLVCRSMRFEAQNIFFSQNRFIIMPPGGYLTELEDCTYTRLPAARFLTEVVPSHALAHIRFLEIQFSPYDVNGVTFDGAMSEDWERTLQALGHSLNYGSLTVRVYCAKFPSNRQAAPHERIRPRTSGHTDDSGSIIMSRYVTLLKPFINFRRRGLRRFFVYASWPCELAPFGRAKPVQTPDTRDRRYEETQKMNKKLERKVMGNCYDSVAVGKEEVSWSQWREMMGDMTVFDGIFFFD
jgi:hypothetical protein